MDICQGKDRWWSIAGNSKRGHDPIVHAEGYNSCPLCAALDTAEAQSERADEQEARANEAEVERDNLAHAADASA